MPYEYQGHVVSNPRAELAVDNAKYVKACTELHLAKRNIEFLWGFDRFVNLEVLWLNGNKVRARRVGVSSPAVWPNTKG